MASDPGLHCLSMCHKKDARLIWANNLKPLIHFIREEMKLAIALDTKILFLLCIIHTHGIDGARTLISQSAEYSVSNGQATDLLLQCAASARDKDYGHKVNTVTGECSAGDSSNPEIGFTFLDKTDTFQSFLNVVSLLIHNRYYEFC